MGHGKRIIPAKLPEKLGVIRNAFNFGLEDMVRNLEATLTILNYSEAKLYRGYIKEFEQGKREPSLPVLLAYARLSKINLEVIVDDALNLPETIPTIEN